MQIIMCVKPEKDLFYKDPTYILVVLSKNWSGDHAGQILTPINKYICAKNPVIKGIYKCP